MVTEEFKDQKDRKILLYCTGGIRCEKASAYFKHLGFSDVNQLHGGVIEYAQQIKKAGLQSRYIGKNFVFDNRMCESIDHRVVGKCHQCGAPADTHVNCANDACHLLFIQCAVCADKYDHCCSVECQEFIELPVETQRALRKERVFNGTINGYKGLRERLMQFNQNTVNPSAPLHLCGEKKTTYLSQSFGRYRENGTLNFLNNYPSAPLHLCVEKNHKDTEKITYSISR